MNSEKDKPQWLRRCTGHDPLGEHLRGALEHAERGQTVPIIHDPESMAVSALESAIDRLKKHPRQAVTVHFVREDPEHAAAEKRFREALGIPQARPDSETRVYKLDLPGIPRPVSISEEILVRSPQDLQDLQGLPDGMAQRLVVVDENASYGVSYLMRQTREKR